MLKEKLAQLTKCSEIFLTISAIIAYSLLIVLFLEQISGCLADKHPDLTSNQAIYLLLIPFLVSLSFQYVASMLWYRKTMYIDLKDIAKTKRLERLSNFLTFAVSVCIAFCVFVKNALYEYLELDALDKLTKDLVAGLVIGTITTAKLTLDFSLGLRKEKQQSTQQKANVTTNNQDRMRVKKIRKCKKHKQ